MKTRAGIWVRFTRACKYTSFCKDAPDKHTRIYASERQRVCVCVCAYEYTGVPVARINRKTTEILSARVRTNVSLYSRRFRGRCKRQTILCAPPRLRLAILPRRRSVEILRKIPIRPRLDVTSLVDLSAEPRE